MYDGEDASNKLKVMTSSSHSTGLDNTLIDNTLAGSIPRGSYRHSFSNNRLISEMTGSVSFTKP